MMSAQNEDFDNNVPFTYSVIAGTHGKEGRL